MKNNPPTPTEKLIKATANGSLKGVKAAIEAGADVNGADPTWGTALYTTCRDNHPRIARYLLSCPGIDITKGLTFFCPQGVAGLYYSPNHEEYNHTPLYAAIEESNLSVAKMLLTHADKGKYLQADENWESTVKGAFNYGFCRFALNLLLDAASPYPQLHQFTISTAVELAFSYRRVAPELASLLKRRAKNEFLLTYQPLAQLITSLVQEDDSYSLEYALKCSGDFCDASLLRPVLENMLHLAQNLKHREIELLLKDQLESVES